LPTTDYTLEWLLPYVRKGMRGTINFEYRIYTDAVLRAMHAAGVPGIVKNDHFHASTGNAFDERQIPDQLKQLIAEAHFHPFRHGYIAPAAADNYNNHPTWLKFNVTRSGREYFNDSEPIPEHARSYLEFLRQLVPKLDSVIDQYITEALKAFEREANFAAAVMVGAASEKAVYLLAASLLNALKPSRRRTALETALSKRQLFALLDCVRKTIEDLSSGSPAPIPYSASEGVSAHLASLFEAIRTQRNDAVHPMYATVSASSVRLLLHSFPYALSTTEKLRAWFDANPGSL
jgi:hypothetical protein